MSLKPNWLCELKSLLSKSNRIKKTLELYVSNDGRDRRGEQRTQKMNIMKQKDERTEATTKPEQ